MREMRATTKAISARINRAAWDWLEMQGFNKNKLLNDLITTYTMILQRDCKALYGARVGMSIKDILHDYFTA